MLDEIPGIGPARRKALMKYFGSIEKIREADEEELMKRISYPGLEAQKHAHAAFIERLVDIDLNKLDEIDNDQQAYLLDLINFLIGWLSNHILASDKKLGEYVRNNNTL